MDTVWVVVSLGAVAASVVMITWSHRRARQPDLGSVSQQWIAEQRFSQTHNSQR